MEGLTGIRFRNANGILEREKELFSRIGMEKIGLEGVEPSLINGGEVWYIAKFKGDASGYIYTIRFVSWFGHIKNDYIRILNPKFASDK